MSDVKKLSDMLKSAPTATSLSGLSMLFVNGSGMLAKRNLLEAIFVDTVEDITTTGVYRPTKEPPLPNGASMLFSAVLSLRAGADLYILAFTHTGSVAYGFKNNSKEFRGWNMLT